MKRVIVILLFTLGLAYGATAFNLAGIKAYDLLVIFTASWFENKKPDIMQMQL